MQLAPGAPSELQDPLLGHPGLKHAAGISGVRVRMAILVGVTGRLRNGRGRSATKHRWLGSWRGFFPFRILVIPVFSACCLLKLRPG